MSNDVLKPDEKPTHDFTMADLQKIQEFEDGGLLGLATTTDVDMARIMDHYLNGMSYREISQTTRIHKTTILYLSKRLNWFAMRREYLEDLALTLRDQVLESKLHSQKFLLRLGYMFERKIGKNVDKFLRSDSADDANKIDLKEIDKYLKVIESIHRLNGTLNSDSGRPLVGVNPGEGMTITKVGDNEIQITPTNAANSGAVKSRLKEFADMKRNLEKEEIKPKRHDINKESMTEKGEKKEYDEEE